MPRVSIIICTYNRPTLLRRAVESAKQSGSDVEVIVVDDASVDETAEVCRSMGGIHYIRLDRNQGVAGARNVGIMASRGEYITFHDDDDVRYAGSIDAQVEVLAANPEVGLVYAPVALGDQDCNATSTVQPVDLPDGDVFWNVLEKMFMPCLSVVLRKSALSRVGLLNPEIPGFDDWDICVRIAELYPVAVFKTAVGVWRIATPFSSQGTSKLGRLWPAFARHQLRLMQLPRARANPERCREVRRRTLNWMSDCLVWEAATWLKKGAHSHAQENLVTALRLNPMRAARPWTLQLLLGSVWRR